MIALRKQNKLICVLEVHDTTGYGEQSAATLAQAVDYWISVQSALAGHQGYAAWTTDTSNVIRRLRKRGLPAHDHGRCAELGPGLGLHHARQRARGEGRRHHR